MSLSPKERVISTIDGDTHDVPPVAIFTQSVTVSMMERRNIFWPEANYDAKQMAALGSAAAEDFGFEAVRSPFSITAEVERLGCCVDRGTMSSTPMVTTHPYRFVPAEEVFPDIPFFEPDEFVSGGNIAQIIESIEILSKNKGDMYPVVAGFSGPLIVAGGLVGIEELMIGTLLSPDDAEKIIAGTMSVLKRYVQELSKAGADVIQLTDGIASPDLLPPELFNSFAGRYFKELFKAVRKTKTSLHICGDTSKILRNMVGTGADCLSIEEIVDPHFAKSIVGNDAILVGNIGAVNPLFNGTPEDIVDSTINCRNAGFDIIAPGCGLSPLTPDVNLRAFRNALI
ncbi:MAG TPA: MtaA/CmuA family methyltransferase [Candidatus Methanomethylophilaceae archaeon]|nr:MtaA/CmuA family methyltransferase [Candidatus Methanomethylophilaceae archaeon]